MKKKMKITTTIYCLFIITIYLLTGCTNQKNDNYVSSIKEWHNKRDSSLTKKNGWLSLAGLYWLEQGENSFGSDSSNQIIFPEKAPKFMGSFFLNDTTVTITVNKDIEIFIDSLRINSMQLKNDNQKGRHILTHSTLSWYIVKRTNKFGIRLKDSEHPNIKAFSGNEYFTIDPAWRIKARLEPYDSAKTISIPNVLGQVIDSPCPGALLFSIDGNTYKVDPIGEVTDDEYWLLFADETSGDETYGAGRFLYVDKVDSSGITYIDFNKAYNPPCVYTPFATCPLPPMQNRLAVRITAGEKNWKIENHK